MLHRGNKLFPWSVEYTSVDMAEDAVSLSPCQDSLMDHVWPKSHLNTWSYPEELLAGLALASTGG